MKSPVFVAVGCTSALTVNQIRLKALMTVQLAAERLIGAGRFHLKTDITEMAQSLKAAAEKATPGQWRRASTQFNGITATPFMLGRKEAMIAGVSEKRDAEFIAMANPANVLALVEALEKAQDTINEMDNRIRKQNRHVCELFDDNTALRQRIAELESRTVTVKQYDEFQICHYGATEDYAKGYIDCQNNFSKWLTAAGIK